MFSFNDELKNADFIFHRLISKFKYALIANNAL